MTKHHVVILGGGFGGLTVARALNQKDIKITLIDRSNHHLFQPLLYQVATAGLSPANIAVPIRSILSKQDNVEVLMAEVEGINPTQKQVLLKSRDVQPILPVVVNYETLIIATGARYNYFGHPEWVQFAPSLKSVVDATRIRKKILLAFEAAEMEFNAQERESWLTFVLVGAGPTGVEMAGSIAELAHQALRSDFRHIDVRSSRILLIEASSRILANFPESLAAKAAERLRSLGVEILADARVEHVDATGVIVSGKKILAKTIVWSAGVVASPAGAWLQTPVDRAGRVSVQPDLSVPGHPNIFVIGDTASVIQEGNPLPGIAPVAIQEGQYIAALIRRRLKGSMNTQPFRYWDKGNLATVGRSYAIAELGKLRLTGWIAWLVWVVVHIYYLIGFRNRIVVLMEWAWAYLTFQRGARLITIDSQD